MRLAKQSQFVPLQNVVYFITLPFLVRKIFIFYTNDVLLFKCPFPGTKVKGLIYKDELMELPPNTSLFIVYKYHMNSKLHIPAR